MPDRLFIGRLEVVDVQQLARPNGLGRPPKNQTPVDQHYVRLREELNRTFETIGLAAA
jgi:hypothetical protein